MDYGFAFGGGGARGFALIGMLKALEEKKIKPKVISGVSAGAIVGALLASGLKAEAIHDLLKNKKVLDIGKPRLSTQGFLKFEGLRKLIKESTGVEDIKDLKIPLYVAVTNLNSGKIEYMNEGPIDKIVAASASIPILFTPVKYKGSLYCDGGVLDNLGAKPLKKKCDKIIGMSLSRVDFEDSISSMIDIALRVFHLTVNSNTQRSKSFCDLLIEPKGIEAFPILSSDKADGAFELGYSCAKELLS